MLNKTMLIGNLGADVEDRCTKNLVAVANFRVATTDRWKDSQGNLHEETEWHRVVAFGRLAEICSQFLAKGSKVYIEGQLRTRKWQDRSDNTRFTTEIIAHEMKMLGNGDKPGSVPDPPQEDDPPLPEDVPF